MRVKNAFDDMFDFQERKICVFLGLSFLTGVAFGIIGARYAFPSHHERSRSGSTGSRPRVSFVNQNEASDVAMRHQ